LGVLDFYDAPHLFHNIAQQLAKSPPSLFKEGELLSCAEATDDRFLVAVVKGAVDNHSHLAFHFFLTSAPLAAKLQESGNIRAAVIFKTLGRAAIAWLRPHQTDSWRTEALLAANLLVARLFGEGLDSARDVRSSQRVAGLPVNQWMDLVENNENRLKWLRMLSNEGGESLRASAKETAITTRYVESHFGQLPGGGDKPSQREIKGFTLRLDALIKLSRMDREVLGFSIRESKRKRKFPESVDRGWNDGLDDGSFERDMRRRVKGYVTGRGGSARAFAKKNLH